MKNRPVLIIFDNLLYVLKLLTLPGTTKQKLQIWAENRQKVTKLSNQLQATNGLRKSRFLARLKEKV